MASNMLSRRSIFGLAGAGFVAAAAAVVAPSTPAQALEPFTKKECAMILTTSSEAFRYLKADSHFDARFPQSLATFIAPSNPEPVRKIIVDGSVARLVASKSDADMKLKRAIIPTLTCDGSPNILTAGEDDVAVFSSIREMLASGPHPLDIQARGVRSVDPSKVAQAKL